MRTILLMAVLSMTACADDTDDAPDVDAGGVDSAPSPDASSPAACGSDDRLVWCAADCSPFIPSHVCPGAFNDACVAECAACAPGGAWCP